MKMCECIDWEMSLMKMCECIDWEMSLMKMCKCIDWDMSLIHCFIHLPQEGYIGFKS